MFSSVIFLLSRCQDTVILKLLFIDAKLFSLLRPSMLVSLSRDHSKNVMLLKYLKPGLVSPVVILRLKTSPLHSNIHSLSGSQRPGVLEMGTERHGERRAGKQLLQQRSPALTARIHRRQGVQDDGICHHETIES